MGFPQWTLWGMGLSIFAALLALAYSLYVQSPSRQMGFQMEPYIRESRVRVATTVAFALLLLTVGFYVAGVPIGEQTQVVAQPDVVDPAPEAVTVAELVAVADSAESEPVAAASSSASGAFGAPLVSDEDEAALDETADDPEPGDAGEPESTPSGPTPTSSPVPTPSNTPTPTPLPTATPTPLPTATPTPTLTPTPIFEDTAQVATGGSTLWVKRTPGGQNLVVVRDGETVILLPGNANQAGLLWKEIATVYGVAGWVQAEFLALGGEEESEP